MRKIKTIFGLALLLALLTVAPAQRLPSYGVGTFYLNGITLTAQSLGFTIAGGTTSKTLTLTYNSTIDQDLATTASPTWVGPTVTTLVFKGTGAYNTTFQAGGATASKTYTWPLTDGTAGQGLHTNASAVLSWGDDVTAVPTGLTWTSATRALSLTSGYMIPGGGTAGQVLMSTGATAPAFSTPTFSVTATAGNALIGDGTNWTSAAILSSTPTGLTYTTATRALSFTAHYLIPGPYAVGSYWASAGATSDPGWATLNQAAVSGLTTADSPIFAGVNASGQNVTAGTGTGLTVNAAGVLTRQIYKVTVTYAGFGTAGATSDKVIGTLPAKTRLVSIIADVTVPFTGGTVATATLKVGKSAGGAEYLAVADVLSGVATFGLADADMGTELVRAARIQGGAVVNWATTIPVTARLTATVDTCDHLTAGSVTFYLITERY